MIENELMKSRKCGRSVDEIGEDSLHHGPTRPTDDDGGHGYIILSLSSFSHLKVSSHI
jgi:hypothetical protein